MNCSALRKKQLLLPVIFFIFLLFSCTSFNQNLPKIDPLSLINCESDIVFAVPVNDNREIVKALVKKSYGEISDENLDALISKISIIYCESSGTGKKASYSLSGICSFPKILLDAVLTRKNGWNKLKYKTTSLETAELNYPSTFEYYEGNKMQLSFPDKEIFCLSSDITPMLEKAAFRNEAELNEKNGWLYSALTEHSIKFLVNAPEIFMKKTFRVSLNFGINNIFGDIIKNVSEDKVEYSMNLELYLKEQKTVKSIYRLLTFALKSMNCNIEMTEEGTILLKDFKMSPEQIISMVSS